MRLGQVLGMRLRALPEDVHPAGLAWLIRAGYVQRLSNGSLAWLPMGQRLLQQIKARLDARLEQQQGQAVTFNVRPRGPSLGNEEGAPPMLTALLEIGRQHIQSYKNLPAIVYDAGDGTRLSLAALSADAAGLDALWDTLNGALFETAQRCGLTPVAVQELTGLSFFAPLPHGEMTALVCPRCGYRAAQHAARTRKPRPAEEVPRPLQKVATPGASTIADLCAFLGIPPERTAKALLLMGSWPTMERLVFVVIRGDGEVNLAKVQQVTGAHALRPATEDEIRACGAEPGYASPIGVRGALVVVDDLIPHAPNLVAGANEAGYHFINVTYGSDFQADVVADVSLVHASDACPECGAALEAHPGLRLLRACHCGAQPAQYQDQDGRMQPWHAALWDVDVAAWAIALADAHHDEQGLRWPVSVAPYAVHVVVLPGKGSSEVDVQAAQVYARLKQAGIPVLLDDRPESAGVKFMDADLLGMPLRVTVSERALKAGGVEVRHRGQEQGAWVPVDALLPHVLQELDRLHRSLDAAVVPWVA